MTIKKPGGSEPGREVCAAVPVFAWFLGPLRWVIQKDRGLSYLDLNTWSMAYGEYGYYFCLLVGVVTVLYLSFPYLRAKCLTLYRQIRQWRPAWNDSTKAR